MATINAKQEVIKNAYGEYWEKVKDYVDENGFINTYSTKISPHSLKYSWDDIEVSKKWIDNKIGDTICFRPKSLQGIENNNGWIRIESEEDLPKEEIDLHFIFEKNNGRFQTFGVWDNKLKSFYSGALKISNVTHYQPIEKPKLPIY